MPRVVHALPKSDASLTAVEPRCEVHSCEQAEFYWSLSKLLMIAGREEPTRHDARQDQEAARNFFCYEARVTSSVLLTLASTSRRVIHALNASMAFSIAASRLYTLPARQCLRKANTQQRWIPALAQVCEVL